ncbi:MAG: hypothetical protein JXA25_09925 [Anaerolineales bacterium]|nr:hypothetical protein [Anaerolineales bacterium]
MNERPGCLSGLLKLAFVRWIYEGLQSRFGFGSGSCFGIGCGLILLIVFIAITCSILTGTNWFKLVLLPFYGYL